MTSTHETTVARLRAGHVVPTSTWQAMQGGYDATEVAGPTITIRSVIVCDPHDPYFELVSLDGDVVTDVRGDLRVIRVAS